MNRLQFLSLLWVLFLLNVLACTKDVGSTAQLDVVEGTFSTPLYLPPMVKATEVRLRSNSDSNGGKPHFSNGLSYHEGLLGPTIESWQNDKANLSITNILAEETNVHWHGILAPPGADGHPEHVISAGQSVQFQFPLPQRANTAWYHPHVHGKTGQQISLGLAGLWLHRDAQESELRLPSGTAEIPLIIQDKRQDVAGNILYAPTSADIATGYFGQTITVNGVPSPYHNVSTRWYRMRVVNSSTARIYNLALNHGEPFWVIGNDGGLLRAPEKVYSALLSPGERLDILVDFRKQAPGTSVFLVSNPFQAGVQGNQYFRLIKFNITHSESDAFELPQQLSEFHDPNPTTALITRTFDIGISHGNGGHDAHATHGGSAGLVGHTINGKIFDMQRIDEVVKAGATEIWEFDNTTGDEAHPMHIHGVHFRVLQRIGGRNRLQPFESGWKDTVLCLPGEKVRVLVDFNAPQGKYVFHCHNIEHGDDGMMLNLSIQ